ncbi:MAG: hypothetical protein QT05_C0017G0007 [archaeon GW2011_AR13]|nr:MAG: hypothetical protein QT05_C0017G0007 [archaeon GW2011_AR13]
MFQHLKVFILLILLFYMDYVKEAFLKVKEDMSILKQEINRMREDLTSNLSKMQEFEKLLKDLQSNNNSEGCSFDRQILRQTDRQINSTSPTDYLTDNYAFEGSKASNPYLSNGNKGVPTNRQTDQQTDRQMNFLSETAQISPNFSSSGVQIPLKTSSLIPPQNSIDNAVNILNSLDNLKKEIRLKFKRLTEQELLIFSTIYQFDEEVGFSDYRGISQKLNLSESSIRDYVQRLIKKGIPIEKNKINNKTIQLSISNNLKKIATLPTILQLRDL